MVLEKGVKNAFPAEISRPDAKTQRFSDSYYIIYYNYEIFKRFPIPLRNFSDFGTE